MSSMSFYPDGRVWHENGGQYSYADSRQSQGWGRHGQQQHEQSHMGDSLWGGAEPSVTSHDSSDNRSWKGDEQGEWFWTPQCWVWGRDLDSAVQDYVRKG